MKIWNISQWTIQHQGNKNSQIFILPLQVKKIASTEQCQNYRSDLHHCTKNIFYSEKNSTKLCAEGAIGNLMNVLHCPQNEVKQLWDIVQSPMHLILQTLGESFVPKAGLKSCRECDSIQKSLWILCKNQVQHHKFILNWMLKKLANSNYHSKEYEISSDHISDGNTCLFSSHCCYLEGDDNWLWIQEYLSFDQWFFEAYL